VPQRLARGTPVAPSQGVTLRIEKASTQGRAILRLIGRMQSEHLPDLRQYIDVPGSKPTLDLEEVTLVDVETVRFLIGCEFAGVELLHCSPYIRQWMNREQPSREKDGKGGKNEDNGGYP
jgi:flagellar biogenesis protein FliO